jgi:hypothetical protein
VPRRPRLTTALSRLKCIAKASGSSSLRRLSAIFPAAR